jgi:hypothetical protein
MDTFPHPTLTPIIGKPTPHALQLLKQELIANAMSVPSTRGGGQHGHLSLVMPAAEHDYITNVAFVIPVHPGQPPVHQNNATNAQIHAADTAYNREIEEFQTYVTTRNSLRAGLLASIEEDYYNLLKDPIFGYATVTPLDILLHLHSTYGNITAKDLEKNRESLKAAWNPEDDIATLWTRIRVCQDFARNTAEPITDNTAMLLILEALTASGVMSTYINEWKRRDSATQTYPQFRAHFDRANKVRVEELTAARAGFHAQTATVTTTPSPAPSANDTAIRVDNVVNMSYCWTHGLGKNSRHTSRTCKHPAADHKHDATILDMKGGCNLIQTDASRRRPRRQE